MKRKGTTGLSLSILGLFLSIVLVLAAANCAAPGTSTAKPIKVAYVNSITGVFGVLGGPITDDFKIVVDQVNKDGGVAGHPVELQIADTESDPAKARTTAKRLIDDFQPHILMGESPTGVAVAVGTVAAESKVPYLSMSGSAAFSDQMKAAGPDAYSWSFRPGPPAAEDASIALVLSTLKQKGIKKLVLLNSESAFGKAYLAFTKSLAPKYALDIVAETSYAPDAVAFGPQILAIKSKPDTEAIFIMGSEVATGLAIVALRDAGVKAPIVGPPSLRVPQLLAVEKIRNAYDATPRVLMLASPLEVYQSLAKDDPVRVHLDKIAALYERAVGKDKVNFAARTPVSWGAWYLLEDALGRLFKAQPAILDKDLATIRSSTRDYIESSKSVATAAGTVTMSPQNHDGPEWGSGVYMVEYQGGKLVYLPEYKLPPTRP